jgi:hypothetical protein
MKKSFMKTSVSKSLLCSALALFLAAPSARSFSLLGPYSSWQVPGIGYNRAGDIGGPMGLGEGFRWNVPVITYAFDKSFIDYFGPDGVHAVDAAMKQFTDLASATKISSDLSEYSTSTVRQNYEAAELNILDLKSTAMSMVIEELGLAEPVRWMFALRARTVTGNPAITNYTTIMRNFDPVTRLPSRYVNDTLYTFQNEEYPAPFNYADAAEYPVTADALASQPVAGGLLSSGGTFVGVVSLFGGRFFTGLTRDDVGGLKYLLHPNNLAVETLLPTVSLDQFTGLNGWVPFVGTNAGTITNIIVGTGTNFVDAGLRGGRNHLRFKRVAYDSLVGTVFVPITNSYMDVVFTNYSATVQHLVRGVVQPDFLFVAEDLGLIQNLVPALTRRTDTSNWIDNDALNGFDETALSHGPGVIPPQVRISFSSILPFFSTDTVDEVPGEDTAIISETWGTYDGTTNAPILYPFSGTGRLTLQQLRQRVFQRGAGL